MPYRATASLLALLLCAGLTQAASLAQVQYRLHLDPSADVEADLRALVERGDQPAMLLLADQLARTGQHQDEAIALYQRAFADGHGEITALAPLAALVERQPDGREAHRTFFAEALQRYPLSRDFATLTTSLDVFLVYPELFPRAEPQALIELYRRACIDACHLNLYRARLAELNGQQALAESLYLQALREDARAVDRLYQALGEQQDTLFPQRVQPLLAEADALPLGTVQAIGSLLSSIPREHDPEVMAWLDNAIARQADSARVAKASYMMSAPENYAAEDVFALIDRIEQTRSQEGRALRASAYLVRGWRTLDPFKAKAIIDGLLAEGYQNAYLNLGELYSMGGLDQVDQAQAIATYRLLAARGVPSAFYRIATIYGGGKGICNDPIKAYAYASLAVERGELGARKYLRELDGKLPAGDRERALQARAGILKELEATL